MIAVSEEEESEGGNENTKRLNTMRRRLQDVRDQETDSFHF